MFENFFKNYNDDSFEAIILVQAIWGMGHCSTYGDMSAGMLAIHKSDGSLIEGKLRLSWPVALDQSKQAFKLFKPLGIYKVRLSSHKIDPDEQDKNLQAYWANYYCLREVLQENIADAALEDIAREFKREISFVDPKFGKLILDKDMEQYTSHIALENLEFILYLELDAQDKPSCQQSLHWAQQLLLEPQLCDSQLRAYAAKELLENACEWQDDASESEEQELDEKSFIERIELSELSVAADGSFSAFYDDGDLFYGHVIIIEGQVPNLKLEDAYIAG